MRSKKEVEAMRKELSDTLINLSNILEKYEDHGINRLQVVLIKNNLSLLDWILLNSNQNMKH